MDEVWITFRDFNGHDVEVINARVTDLQSDAYGVRFYVQDAANGDLNYDPLRQQFVPWHGIINIDGRYTP